MNIQDAKDEIKRTLRTYTRKTASGQYLIPIEKQRPILLIGPPGIGKTAIMKQIAAETGMGLVSYTMTHHTRQSAIGLPMVRERQFAGRTVSVTEYTMSEIVSSMYIYMEETGLREGILFLDEINCVSETLTPVMLQLLQNKTFGTHPLPPGWLIVAAGNPPEYNRSVRELDMVTLDRVKNMEISADLNVWNKYAASNHVHPAVRAYLSVYPDHFYSIRNDSTGQSFVTARGWEDLSTILLAYEKYDEKVTDPLFLQYLQDDSIAHSFALFYRLFRDAWLRFDATRKEADSVEPDNIPKAQVEADSTATDRFEVLRRCFSSDMSTAESLAATAMLYHRIEWSAGLWWRDSEERSSIRSILTVLSGNSAMEKLQTRQEALKVRYDKELITTENYLREKQRLETVESFFCSDNYRKDPEGSLSGFLNSMIFEEESSGQAVSQDIEESYQLIRELKLPYSCFVYFTSDLTQDENVCRILLRWPSPSYTEALSAGSFS